MRFLIDAQLPPALAPWIVAKGHAADHVMSLGMIAATDRAIADLAQRNGAILVTKDADFIVLRRPDRFALLWLRIGNATKAALTAWLSARWPDIEHRLISGERMVEAR